MGNINIVFLKEWGMKQTQINLERREYNEVIKQG